MRAWCRVWLVTVLALGCQRSFPTPEVRATQAPPPLQASASPATVAPRGKAQVLVSGGVPPATVRLEQADRHSGEGASYDPETGTYTAGPTGSVADVLRVRDSAGAEVEVVVNVTAALSVAPSFVSLGPGQAWSFAVAGGAPAYCYALSRPGTDGCPAPESGPVCDPGGTSCRDGGGACVDGTGAVHAGACGPQLLTLTVTDQNQVQASATAQVGPSLEVDPPEIEVASGLSRALVVKGGVPPYSFQFAPKGDLSGGSMGPNGVYTAGPNVRAVDRLEVRDAAGSSATVTARVATPAFETGSATGEAVVTGDFNGDLITDAVVVGQGPYGLAGGALTRLPEQLHLFLGSGGGLQHAADIPVAGAQLPGFEQPVVVDLDGDGRDDLVLPIVDPEAGGQPRLVLLVGRADGTFDVPAPQPSPYAYSQGHEFSGGLASLRVPGGKRLTLVGSGPGGPELGVFALDASRHLQKEAALALPTGAGADARLVVDPLGGLSGADAWLFEPSAAAATGCTSGQVAFVPVRLLDADGGYPHAPDGGELAPTAGQALCFPKATANDGANHLAYDPVGILYVDFLHTHQPLAAFYYAGVTDDGSSAGAFQLAVDQVDGYSVGRWPLRPRDRVVVGANNVGRPELDVLNQGNDGSAAPQRLALLADAGLGLLAPALPSEASALALGDFDFDGAGDAVTVDPGGQVRFFHGSLLGDFNLDRLRALKGSAIYALGTDLDGDGVTDVLAQGDPGADPDAGMWTLWGVASPESTLAVGPAYPFMDIRFWLAAPGGVWSVGPGADGSALLQRFDVAAPGGLASSHPIPTSYPAQDVFFLDYLRAGGAADGGDLVTAFLDPLSGTGQVLVAQLDGAGQPTWADVSEALTGGADPLVAVAPGGAGSREGLWALRGSAAGGNRLELHPATGAGAPAYAASPSAQVDLPVAYDTGQAYPYSFAAAPGGPRDRLALVGYQVDDSGSCTSAELDLLDPGRAGSPRVGSAVLACSYSPVAVVIAPGDLDGDGRTDLLIYDGQAVFVEWQNPDGSFTEDDSLYEVTWFSNANGENEVALFGDFNGDGYLDVATLLPRSNEIDLLLNHRDRTFY